MRPSDPAGGMPPINHDMQIIANHVMQILTNCAIQILGRDIKSCYVDFRKEIKS
jgi:hypothetical protein